MAKNKIIALAIGIIVIGAAALSALSRQSKISQPITNSDGENSYTLADVASHNTKTSCWSAINGNVYDLTSWIPQHPGGEQAILGICGKDGSTAFNKQHDEAPEQAQILVTFKIGKLVQ